MNIEKMKQRLENQLEKEYEYSPVRGVAKQLMDIVGSNEERAAVVLEDFAAGRTVKKCEQEIKKWVDGHHKGNSGYCPPDIADGIIRKYFGLPEAGEKPQQRPQPKRKNKTINLADFL